MKTFVWRSHIYAPDSTETRFLAAAISIYTHHTSASVACAACAGVASRTLVIADCVRVAVVLSSIAGSNLYACHVGAHIGKCVALVACAVVRVRPGVSAASSSAWAVKAVVDVCASLSVAIETIWAGAACVAHRRRRKVVARHARKARRVGTAVLVTAL